MASSLDVVLEGVMDQQSESNEQYQASEDSRTVSEKSVIPKSQSTRRRAPQPRKTYPEGKVARRNPIDISNCIKDKS